MTDDPLPNQTTLLEDEIIDACDCPSEAIEAIAAHRGCSLAEAALIVERGWQKDAGHAHEQF